MVLTRDDLSCCRATPIERLLRLEDATSHLVLIAVGGMLHIVLHGHGTGGPLVKASAEGVVHWIPHRLLFLLE
jgi:hypothetical protein